MTDRSLPPHRARVVEPVPRLARENRKQRLAEAGYNPFRLRSRDVTIDLLTDSGTGAMSIDQWAALMRGDEAYAGSRSFDRFEASVREVLGFEHVIPVHQGRGAEKVLAEAFVEAGDVVPGNAPFDTTRAHIEHRGARVEDVTADAARRPHVDHPFKGNVDPERLEECLAREVGRIPFVLVTVTCNSVGGHPVSLANLHAVEKLCRAHGVPLILDVARYAENALLVKRREPGEGDRPVAEIVHETMGLADAVAMSAKKDALVNIGGFLAARDRVMYDRLAPLAVLHEGYLTYGGLAGRDLDAMAVGLREGIDEDFLDHYVGQVRYLWDRLDAFDVPLVRPPGSHAVYLDAAEFLPHVPWDRFPGHALALALYVEGGVRACEIGSLLLGRDPESGENRRAEMELCRLALPRRVYGREHLDHVVQTVERVWERRDEIPGVAFADEAPTLRHFLSTFEPTPAPREPG